jgi:hypothetical protein
MIRDPAADLAAERFAGVARQPYLVRCPDHNGMVPVVNRGGFYAAQVARHAIGPLIEVAPDLWCRLPCLGSWKIVNPDGTVRPTWHEDLP